MKIEATAPNDSQKPVAVTAHGSHRHTTAAALDSTAAALSCSRSSSAAATVASITNVRCAGTPHPASRQYPSAPQAPAIARAVCTGATASRRGEMRQSAPAASATRPAIIVI